VFKINQMNLNKFFKNAVGILLIYGLAGLAAPSAWSLTYRVPSRGNVVGEYKKIKAEEGDTLLDIAQRYDIGMYEIMRANPRLVHHHLRAGTTVIIPSEFVLPSGPRNGIVLNVAEMRVFAYHPDEGLVSTYPVGIGRQGWSTPLGTTQIVSKEPHPAWHPPASIRAEAARKGKTLPMVVPAGPHNPLGQYAMHLGFKGILMHGTNAPSSIGLRSSHGCIRLFANDIEELYSMSPIGTSVRVVYEPHGD